MANSTTPFDVLADQARTLGIETPARNKELHGDGVVAAAGRNRFIEPVRVVDAGHVAFNSETGPLRNINCTNGYLQGLAGQLLPVLPDPRRIHSSNLADRCSRNMSE